MHDGIHRSRPKSRFGLAKSIPINRDERLSETNMVATRAHKPEQPKSKVVQKQAAKKIAAAAGKKSHTENVPRQLSPEIESESESEDIDEILARIESDQAKLTAKKAAKPLTKRAALEAQRALLDKQIDELKNAEVRAVPKTARKALHLADKKKEQTKKRARADSEDELVDSDVSSDSEASIQENRHAPVSDGALEKDSILSSYRKVLKELPVLSRPPMRLTLR